MRPIRFITIVLFGILITIDIVISYVLTKSAATTFSLHFDNHTIICAIGIAFFYAMLLIIYRIFIKIWPIPIGEIVEASAAETIYHMYLLFNIIFFFPLMRTRFLPVPLTRILYKLLGARIGPDTVIGGTILDPPLVEIGSNTIVGEDVLVFCHAVEGRHLSHYPVRIGSNVTVGARSILMPGVTLGDHAMVAVGSVVLKGTAIGNGEVWGGVPAKRLR